MRSNYSWLRGILISALLLIGLPNPVTAATRAPYACEADGTQTSGAIYRICMPDLFWNGDLILFAHGYVSPTLPVGIPEGQLNLNGTSVPAAVTSLGYAFAVTSYSANGLAVKEGVADVIDLVSIFKSKHAGVKHVYLMGFSEGGLVSVLALEQSDVFSGALAACGQLGSFTVQANHFGDFRTAFDYFFPSLLPGTPISIPTTLIDNFDTVFTNTIAPQLSNPANAISLTQLVSVTGIPAPITATAVITQAVRDLLWYNVYGTMDGISKLKGQPYDNMTRVYSGSLNDTALNAGVQRFAADAAALTEMEAFYKPLGRPRVPLVTLHTTGDEIVPYRHEDIFRERVVARGMTPRHDNVPVTGYGHCAFSVTDIQSGLTLLQQRVQNPVRFRINLPVLTK